LCLGEALSRKEAKKKKKNQAALDSALANLSKSVENHDVMLGEMLREIMILYDLPLSPAIYHMTRLTRDPQRPYTLLQLHQGLE